MSLQGFGSGFLEVEILKDLSLLRGHAGDAAVGVLADGGAVLLDAAKQLQCAGRTQAVAAGFESHAHHPVKHQCKKADLGVGSDALGQPVVDGGDLNVGFEHPKAALDIGKALVAAHDLGGAKVGDVGEQHEFAVKALGVSDCVGVNRVAEALGLVVGVDEARELGIGDGPRESRVGTPVGGAAPALGEPFVLGVELAGHALGQRLDLGDAGTPARCLLAGTHRIVGDHQALVGKSPLGQAVGELQRLHRAAKFRIPSRRHGKNEFNAPLTIALGQLGQLADVVHAEQAPIGHQDHPLDAKALEHPLEHRLQRARLGHVTRVHGVHERQAVGRLHQTEHELAGNARGLLVHAVGPQVVFEQRLAVDAHRGEVVKHHGEFLVNQRTDVFAELLVDRVGVIADRIHGAQQVIVAHRRRHARYRHRVEPAQHAELGVGVTQPVKHHGAHERFGIERSARGAQHPTKNLTESEIAPELVKGIDVAIGQRAVVLDRMGRVGAAPESAVQAIDEWVEVPGFELIETPVTGGQFPQIFGGVDAARAMIRRGSTT